MLLAVAITSTISSAASAKPISDIITVAAKIHRLTTDALFANKYCPKLKVDDDNLTLAMIKLGGAEDGVADALTAFRKTDQAQAFFEQRKKEFGSKMSAERDYHCELANLLYGGRGAQTQGVRVLVPK